MVLGEIYIVDFGMHQGSEIGNVRPAVIISTGDEYLYDLIRILPITGWRGKHNNNKYFFLLLPTRDNGLYKKSAVDLFQTKTIGKEKCRRNIGKILPEELDIIIEKSRSF